MERGDPVGGANPGCEQRPDDRVPVHRRVLDPQRVVVPGVLALPGGRSVWQYDSLDVGQLAVVHRGELLAAALPLHQVRQLPAPDGGPQVGHGGVETAVTDARSRNGAVVPATSGAGQAGVQAGRPDQLGTFRVVGRDHAALADGQVRRRVEAEARSALTTHWSIAQTAPETLRGIFHHHGQGKSCGVGERVHVRGVAGLVGEHQRHRWPTVAARRESPPR